MKADITLKAMGIMGYNAMNLGGSDFSFGVSYLEKASETVAFPFISSNIVDLSGESPNWLKNYIIIQSGGTNVGILGVMPESAFDKLPTSKEPSNLKIISPATALRRLLPEVLKQADFIILLSQLNVEDTSSLANEIPGIDLALSHENRDFHPVLQDGKTLITPCGTKSSNIEIVKLTTDDAGETAIVENKPIVLGDEFPHDTRVDKLIAESYFKKQLEIRNQKTEKLRQEFHKALREGLAKTPEEFFKEMKEEKDDEEASRQSINP